MAVKGGFSVTFYTLYFSPLPSPHYLTPPITLVL